MLFSVFRGSYPLYQEMGIIIRQGLKSSIVTYIGVMIGIFNMLILYNTFLTQEELGLYASTLLTFPVIYMSVTLLGVPHIAVRFHSQFSTAPLRRQLFTFMLAAPFAGLTVFTIVYLLFKPAYVNFYEEHSPLLLKYYYTFIPLTAGMVYLTVLESYSRINLRIAVPTLIREVGLRLCNSAIVLLYGFELITFDTMVQLTVLAYVLAIVAMLCYLHLQGKLFFRFDFGFVRHPAFREMYRYGLWVILGGAATALLPHIEKVLLPGFEGGLSNTAIFDIASRIAVIIAIPKNSIVLISAPILSSAIHRNDMKEVESIYKKSSLNLYIIGSLLLLGIWCNVDAVFELIPNSDIYASGKWVVLMIGLARLTDMMTGLNSEILTNSRFFRYDLLFVFLLTILLAASNMYLIPRYGYNGAAAASFVSMLIYNMAKLIFIYRKMHVQPFSMKTLQVTLLGIVTFLVASAVPHWFPATFAGTIGDVLIRSAVIVIIFGGGIVLWKISDEISAGWNGIIQLLNRKQ